LNNNFNAIAIIGPTAAGKTDVSLELSEMINCEIISADSRQIYKYLDIGTAKPKVEELKKVPHYFIDIIEPDCPYSAGKFAFSANEKVIEILESGKTPLIVGGSGLYIKALCEGLFDEEENYNKNINRIILQERFEKEGIEKLYKELLAVDKKSADLYLDKNPRRIIRALEYYLTMGEPISNAYTQSNIERSFNTLYFYIDMPRNVLYERINFRSEKMWESGLVEETEKILKMGFSTDLNSLNTVGYKETIQFLKDEISAEDALNEIKKNTRRYAKRQVTWFTKVENVHKIYGTTQEIAFQIMRIYTEKTDAGL